MINPFYNKNVPEEATQISELQLEELMDQYGPSVLRLAFTYVKDKSLAEDIFQEVFIKVYKSGHKVKDPSQIKWWIYRITVNLCKDLMRRHSWKRNSYTSNEYILEQVDPRMSDDNLLQLEQNSFLMNQIMKLPLQQRQIILLYYYEELDSNQISAILNIAPGTVRIRLHRARQQLKSMLKEEQHEEFRETAIKP